MEREKNRKVACFPLCRKQAVCLGSDLVSLRSADLQRTLVIRVLPSVYLGEMLLGQGRNRAEMEFWQDVNIRFPPGQERVTRQQVATTKDLKTARQKFSSPHIALED